MRDCARSFVLLAAIAAGTTPLIAQCANAWAPFGHLPGVNALVSSLVSWDPDGPGPATTRVALGGRFSAAGSVLAGRVAAWDPAVATWSPIGAGIPFQDQLSVNVLLALPNGDLVAGGLCYPTNPLSGEPLLRWNGSSWTPFGGLTASPGFGVRAIARLPNGDLAVGGGFSAAGLPTLANVAVWNGASWSTLGGGTNAPVHDLVVMPNGDLLAVGDFTVAGGVPANGVARWNGTTWSSVGGGVSGGVARARTAVVLANGDLIVGGEFTHAGGVPASHLARWDGAAWSDIGGGIGISGYAGNMGVFELALLPNGDLVAGGFFTHAGGSPIANVARWNGTAWSALGNSGSLGYVSAFLVLPNGDLLAGGEFQVAGGVGASRVARWDGTAWSPLNPGEAPSSYLRALRTMPDGSLVAGGAFQAAGAVAANGIARWDGGSWSTLGSPPGGYVNATGLRPNGDLVVGGYQFVGTWDGASWTTHATSFAGGVPHADIVEAVAVLPNGDLVVGGDFSQIEGQWIFGLARWNGVAWSRLGGQDLGEVHALAVVDNGDLVAGGDLWMASPIHGIARWNGSSWSPLGGGVQSWGSSGEVFAIAPLPNGALIAGGQFTTAGGAPANNIARWDGTAWSPLGTGINGRVRTVHVLPNGDVIAAGDFTQAGGVTVGGVARWNGSTWGAVAGNVANVRVFAITADAAGALLLGGDFAAVGGVVSPNLVRLTTTCPAGAVTAGAGCAGDTVTATLPWTGSTWRADASGLPNAAAVFVVDGFATASLPLASVFATALTGCTLHVQPDVVDLVFASTGAATFQFVLPNTPSLAGTVFHHQMVPLALDSTLAVTATNSLQLTVGSF